MHIKNKRTSRLQPVTITALGLAATVGLQSTASAATLNGGTLTLRLSEVRSVDGSSNNLNNATYGQVGQTFSRHSSARYGDGISTLHPGPNVRSISNQVFAQPNSLLDENGMSDFGWAWGQFLSHDISHTLTSSGDFASVTVPVGDPVFSSGQMMPMTRSQFDPTTGITTPRQQVNDITPWLDAGFVYGGRAKASDGTDTVRANWLRTGHNGRLETHTVNGQSYLPVASQKSNAPGMGEGPRGMADPFVAGDVRANENAVLSAMHTLMVREHNRVADEIAVRYATELASMSPEAQDEFIYQSARKVVAAEIQAITYNEYLPSMGVRLSTYSGYDNGVDPTVTNEFSTAGFRLGHSQISGVIHRLNPDGTTHAAGDLNLFEAFFDADKFLETDIDSIFRGLAANIQQKTDAKVTDDLRNLLFGPPTAGPFLNGTDLVSLNIQRGRDHGLGSYNQTRVAYGLSAMATFADITDDVTVQQALASVYSDVNEIDLWVGMLAEAHRPGASVGELIEAILADQFERLRDGDRFWHEHDADFRSDGTLAAIGFDQAYFDSFTLGQLIANNTDIEAGQLGRAGNAFFVADEAAQSVPEPPGIVGIFAGIVGVSMVGKRTKQNP